MTLTVVEVTSGAWRWLFKDERGVVVGGSTISFSSPMECLRSLVSLVSCTPRVD